MVRVSKHASQRLKERCGLKKKSVRRMADIAFMKGMKEEDTSGQLNPIYGKAVLHQHGCKQYQDLWKLYLHILR